MADDRYTNLDGMVAVLYSPGFGSGWYTTNSDHPELLFDPNIVAMVLEDRGMMDIKAYVLLKYGDNVWCGGLEDLEIRWIPKGSKFRINEYDGSEEVILDSEEKWFIA